MKKLIAILLRYGSVRTVALRVQVSEDPRRCDNCRWWPRFLEDSRGRLIRQGIQSSMFQSVTIRRIKGGLSDEKMIAILLIGMVAFGTVAFAGPGF